LAFRAAARGGRALGLRRQRALRGGGLGLAAERLLGRATPLARGRARLALLLARLVVALRPPPGRLRGTSRARWAQGHARAPGLRQADRDRLLAGARAVLAPAYVLDLLAHEFA